MGSIDKVFVVVAGGVIVFGVFLLAAIIAVLMHDAEAGELPSHVYPPGMGDRMLFMALPGDGVHSQTAAGNLRARD
jgi:hypothetical protein